MEYLVAKCQTDCPSASIGGGPLTASLSSIQKRDFTTYVVYYVNNDLEAVQKVDVEVDVPTPHLHMAAKNSGILML